MLILWWRVEETGIEALACARISPRLRLLHYIFTTMSVAIKSSSITSNPPADEFTRILRRSSPVRWPTMNFLSPEIGRQLAVVLIDLVNPLTSRASELYVSDEIFLSDDIVVKLIFRYVRFEAKRWLKFKRFCGSFLTSQRNSYYNWPAFDKTIKNNSSRPSTHLWPTIWLSNEVWRWVVETTLYGLTNTEAERKYSRE